MHQMKMPKCPFAYNVFLKHKNNYSLDVSCGATVTVLLTILSKFIYQLSPKFIPHREL